MKNAVIDHPGSSVTLRAQARLPTVPDTYTNGFCPHEKLRGFIPVA